jgi:hypothetical protein
VVPARDTSQYSYDAEEDKLTSSGHFSLVSQVNFSSKPIELRESARPAVAVVGLMGCPVGRAAVREAC